MDIRDSVKALRNELGITQLDLAKTLHISVGTVSRWELGRSRPARSALAMLIEYAKHQKVSPECVEQLKETSDMAIKSRIEQKHGNLFAVEHTSLEQLIDDASFPIYVCDIETDKILYINHITETQLGKKLHELTDTKCYECIMHRDKPCEFCHKNQLNEDCFSGYEAYRRFDGNYYRVLGKRIKWNGHDAQIRYAFELGGAVSIASKNTLFVKYEEQLLQRRKNAVDALAFAHYNLTRGTVAQIEYRNEEIAKRSVAGGYDETMQALEKNIYSPDERKKFDSIRNRDSLLKQYFKGKTHIGVKYRINGLPGYYEGLMDLFQNPVTYDIEAFATLRDITDEFVSDAVVSLIMQDGFESIITIDVATGNVQAYRGKHINEVIKQQEKHGDNIAGAEAYLRLNCADKDSGRVIRETSLPYVKEQLKTKPVLTVAYSLHEDGKIKYKQTQFTYLDEEQTMILCAIQNISEAYRQLE